MAVGWKDGILWFLEIQFLNNLEILYVNPEHTFTKDTKHNRHEKYVKSSYKLVPEGELCLFAYS